MAHAFFANSRGAAVWLPRGAGRNGDPSLRLKNGYVQDDKVREMGNRTPT